MKEVEGVKLRLMEVVSERRDEQPHYAGVTVSTSLEQPLSRPL